jgi:hypothetical protein
MSSPDPDECEVTRFAGAIFRYATPGTYVLQRLFEEGSHRPYRPNTWKAVPIEDSGLGNIIESACELIRIAASADRPALFAAPLCTFSTPANAKETNVHDGLVISVELDERPLAAWERLANAFGPVSVVVASGGDWVDPATGEVQPRLHCHWLLDKAAQGFERLVRLREARRIACALVGGDPSGVPIAHPYRWPGSWHRKSELRLARTLEWFTRDGRRIHL